MARQQTPPSRNAGHQRPRRTARWTVAFVFVFLTVVYLANGEHLPGNDATANMYLAVNVVDHGALSFAPTDFPFMFAWRSTNGSPDPVGPPSPTAILAGTVEPAAPIYYLTPGAHAGTYVSAFSFGSAMLAVPVFAALKLAGHDPGVEPDYRVHGAKVVATLLVAASAVFVCLIALEFCSPAASLTLALAYGLGTCAWSLSSQALWQHGPTQMFLALGAWLLIRSRRQIDRSGLWCGGALAAAVLCRPTSAMVVICVGVYLLITDRRTLTQFVLGGVPFAMLLAWYNWHYLGSPIAFGETGAGGAAVAMHKTGNPDVWQTPLLDGVLGVLFSPARGLFVYSPFLLFAIPSMFQVFRDPRYRVFMPFLAGAICIMLIASKWFDWWGGWSFGYRPLVETMPLMILLLIPGITSILARPVTRILCGVLLLWSIGVQALGAFAYDLTGWNDRSCEPPQFDVTLRDVSHRRIVAPNVETARAQAVGLDWLEMVEVRQDIDLPEFRHRLWSITDNPISYYVEHFDESRRAKTRLIESELKRR